MIDLETLGLHNNAVILSLGAALFSLSGEVEPLYHRRIKIASCIKAGLIVDGGTIEWWMNQREEVKNKLFSVEAKELSTVLWEFENVVLSTIPDFGRYIWSHGSNFDVVLYENACKLMGRQVWWHYKDVRDTRTLFALADYRYEAKGGKENALHDALDDAMNQAKAVCEAYAKLKGGINNGSN